MTKKSVTILGSTGSVGRSSLDLMRSSNEFDLFAITANQNEELLIKQCREFNPRIAVIGDENLADSCYESLKRSDCDTELKVGRDALDEVASDSAVDIVIAAIVGSAGLNSTINAAKSGKRILLANKEALIMSGQLFMKTALESGSTIIPIDSEHSGIFQCLNNEKSEVNAIHFKDIEKLVLTASGGPFLNLESSDFKYITPEMACAHPTWKMGKKISVDSASMMNKGLELIEAHHLFNVDMPKLDAIIHPQSIVHALVYFLDGSVLAQLANPDMRIPIAYGLTYPRRMESGVEHLDLVELTDLQFLEVDEDRFPCLKLARLAANEGGSSPIILNAANEIAVEAFLRGKISFVEIPQIIEEVMMKIPCESPASIAIIHDLDLRARQLSNQLINKGS